MWTGVGDISLALSYMYLVHALWFSVPKDFYINWFSSMMTLSSPGEGYYSHVSCPLNLISTFLLFALLC